MTSADPLSRIRSIVVPLPEQKPAIIGYHCASTASRSSNLVVGESFYGGFGNTENVVTGLAASVANF